jgi:tRNA U34 2-thiouridine synthase MnmA/TrmU
MKIASLVSGGVDSSVTIPLIKEMGYDPHLFYIEIGMKDDPNWIDCPDNFLIQKQEKHQEVPYQQRRLFLLRELSF